MVLTFAILVGMTVTALVYGLLTEWQDNKERKAKIDN